LAGGEGQGGRVVGERDWEALPPPPHPAPWLPELPHWFESMVALGRGGPGLPSDRDPGFSGEGAGQVPQHLAQVPFSAGAQVPVLNRSPIFFRGDFWPTPSCSNSITSLPDLGGHPTPLGPSFCSCPAAHVRVRARSLIPRVRMRDAPKAARSCPRSTRQKRFRRGRPPALAVELTHNWLCLRRGERQGRGGPP